jgi:hypothetical protein
MSDIITKEERQRIKKQIDFLVNFLQNEWNLYERIKEEMTKESKRDRTPTATKTDLLKRLGFENPTSTLNVINQIVGGNRLTMKKTKGYYELINRLGL